jgi:hypothetical protein
MSSDRARVSYDPRRQYRSVVAQQGRVTLDADVNEAQEIAGEILRTETIDIVGPSGTPDDGYKVAAVPGDTTRDFAVGAGTMYVGGERVTLPAAVKYTTQTEWLDRAGDPLWASPPQAASATEFIYLFLREQEVSAVEDTALREVALGGPDTAQRKRLLQRIVRLPVNADTCVTALQAAQAAWSAAGANFDAATMMLRSPATLKVALLNQPTTGTVCEPQAQGGYIGADNQLIRVQISHCDANKSSGRLVWSRDNASFLHRLKPVDPANPALLHLMTTPVDAYHAPRANHPVEVLRCAVPLSDDPAIGPLNRDYVAAHTGVISTPALGLAADQSLTLPAALPAEYQGGSAPLFLRLWEEELPFTSGTPVTLTGTGLQVVIDLHNSAGSFTVGQFWMFAARPNTPAEVYPHRYLFAPQPPEGPRLWVCPLATIGWQQQTLKLLDDCRNPFDNLVELTKRHDGCCGVVITPGEVGGGAGLQALIDKLAGQKATVSLMPGRYELPQPLMLFDKHSELTIEGCHDGAVLSARADAEDNFVLGIVQLLGVNNLTLRRLRFHMPLAHPPLPKDFPPLAASIGVLAVHCADLRIEECLFRFRLTTDIDLYAAGIFATSECWNLSVERNRFLHDDEYERAEKPKRFLVGLLATAGFPPPEFTRKKGQPTLAGNKTDAVAILLDNARITRNEFAGLTMAVYARAEIGRVFCDDNIVHGCDGGFYFATTDLAFLRESLLQSYRPEYRNEVEQKVFVAGLQATQAPLHLAMYDFAMHVQMPDKFVPAYTLKIGKSPTATMARATTAMAKSGYAQLLAAFSGEAKPAQDFSQLKTDQPAHAMNAGAGIEEPAEAMAEHTTTGSQKIKMTLAPYYAALPDERADRLIPHLRFTGNDVEILPLMTDSEQEPDLTTLQPLALFVSLPPGEDASVAASANCLRGSTLRGFIAIVQQPTVATFTGNMVLNNAGDDRCMSLWLQAEAKRPLMNASGNTFRGVAKIVPYTPNDAGCDAPAWRVLNSTQY